MENSVLIPPIILQIYSSGSVACRFLILLYLAFSTSELSCQLEFRKKNNISHCFNGAITMLWEDWTEERPVDTGGGSEAACLHSGARTWELASIACEGGWVFYHLPNEHCSWDLDQQSCRLAEVWEELQTEVDKLPKTGHQEGQVQLARRADHHPAPCSFRQQVSTSEISQLQIVTVSHILCSAQSTRDPLAYVSYLAPFC